MLVEKELKRLGCERNDGDCSNMFKEKAYDKISNYFNFLSNAVDLKGIIASTIVPYGKLKGKRYDANYRDVESIKDIIKDEELF